MALRLRSPLASSFLPFSRSYTSQTRPFIVLGIESSCDDTAVAVVTSDRKVLSNVRIGQMKYHEPYKGIVPNIAVLQHSRNMPFAIKQYDSLLLIIDLLFFFKKNLKQSNSRIWSNKG